MLKMLPKSKEIQQPEPFHLYYRCIPTQRKDFFPKKLKNSGANRSKISRAVGSLKWGSHPKVGNCLAGPQSQTSLIPSPPLQTALPFTLSKPMNPGELRRVKNNFSVQVSSPQAQRQNAHSPRPFHRRTTASHPKPPTKEPNPTHEKLQKVLT